MGRISLIMTLDIRLRLYKAFEYLKNDFNACKCLIYHITIKFICFS